MRFFGHSLSQAAIFLVASFGLASAFVPSTNRWVNLNNVQQRQQSRYTYGASLARRTATMEKQDEKERMTETDAEVLFGEEEKTHSDYRSEERKKDVYGNILADHSLESSTNDGKLNTDLDHAPNNPLVNKLRTMRDTLQNCPEIWLQLSQIMPASERAIYDNHMCDTKVDLTFAQTADLVKKSASIFANEMNIGKGKNVAILGENSAYWLLLDHGIQMAGGASAVRGADAPLDELRYIYQHSDSAGVAVLQDVNLLKKLNKDASEKNLEAPLGFYNEKHGSVKKIILMHRGKKNKNADTEIAKIAKELDIEIKVFSDLLETAKPLDLSTRPAVTKEDLATIVYTSGTTGNPKGVMLSHGNLLHQISHRLAPSKPYEESEPLPGETMVSLLPVWHITERTFELWMLTRGCNVAYSSIRTFKKDLALHKPEWMVLVPRVLEKVASGVQEKFSSGSAVVKTLSKFFTAVGRVHSKHTKIVNGLVVGDEAPGALEKVTSNLVLAAVSPLHALGKKLVWSKVQEGFGGRLKVIISGGSALAGGLETFYETAGLTICVGYGLTECSPLISYRRSDANLVTGGCTGKACVDTELRVVDPEAKVNGNSPRPALPAGQAGLVLARGPQVMRGYYKNPEATAKAIDKFGWFDTGDLGRVNPATGDLILTGRAKDTIVLSNGENIEPVPIEDAILGDIPIVDQVMLTGQDGRGLVAITVLNPQELYNEGFLQDENEATKLKEAMDAVNIPQCTPEDCEKYCKILNEASAKLRSNKELKSFLESSVKEVTRSNNFRKWEQVQQFYVTLEPFAMANGQLTQSYKVKRAQVMERYGDELPK